MSPAGISSGRLACSSPASGAAATGSEVYALVWDCGDTTEGQREGGDAVVGSGGGLGSSRVLGSLPLRGLRSLRLATLSHEVMAVAVVAAPDGTAVCAVSSLGELWCGQYDTIGVSAAASPAAKRARVGVADSGGAAFEHDAPLRQWCLSAPASVREVSPAAVAASPTAAGKMVFCHQASKCLSWVADGAVARTLWSSGCPTAVALVGEFVFAVAEWREFSMWDVRIPDRKCCVARECVSDAPLWTINARETMVAVSGTDPVVHVYDRLPDVRNEGLSWYCPAKYGVAGVRQAAGQRLFVAGMDNEVLSGTWDLIHTSKKHIARPNVTETGTVAGAERSKLDLMFNTGFRGDGRWVGFDVLASPTGVGDVLVGLSETGHLYTVPRAEHLPAAVSGR